MASENMVDADLFYSERPTTREQCEIDYSDCIFAVNQYYSPNHPFRKVKSLDPNIKALKFCKEQRRACITVVKNNK